MLPKEKNKHQPIHKIFWLIYNDDLPTSYIRTKFVLASNQYLICSRFGPLHEMEPIHYTAWVTKSLRLDNPGTYGKTKYHCILL